MVNRSRGRPRGGSDARQRLLDAASQRFLSDGYTGTSLRAIAAQAGADHSLVNYHFGGKDGLFIAVVDLHVNPGRIVGEALGHGPSEAGHRLLSAVLAAWDHPPVQRRARELLLGMQLQESTGRAFRTYLQSQVADQITAALGGAGASKRAGATASVVVGIFLARYVVRLEPLATMPRAEVVELMAPAIQACLAPPRRQRPFRATGAARP